MVIPNLRADSHALRTRAPLDPKISFDLHVLGMPPAFVLSHDQTLKFMSAASEGGISPVSNPISRTRSAHFFRSPHRTKPAWQPITYGYVKDI